MQDVLYFNRNYRVFLLRDTSFGLQNIFRAQCRPSDAFKKVKFRLRTKEIWVDLNVHVLQIFQPQKFRQIFRWHSRYEKLSIAFLRLSIYPRVPELSISQEIGLFEFLHQPFICGQTELFIHKTHLAKYHGLLIYHTPRECEIWTLLSAVCMGCIDTSAFICSVQLHQKLKQQIL